MPCLCGDLLIVTQYGWRLLIGHAGLEPTLEDLAGRELRLRDRRPAS